MVSLLLLGIIVSLLGRGGLQIFFFFFLRNGFREFFLFLCVFLYLLRVLGQIFRVYRTGLYRVFSRVSCFLLI